jgi:hypothetical protein
MSDPFSVDGAAYDYSIAGLKFVAATSSDNPSERAFARVSKEMVNTSPQPGDASLDGWWIRSATDWTGGAGYEFMEPIEQDPIPRTYAFSYGVDPWTNPGEITLLRTPFPSVGLPSPTPKGVRSSFAAYGPYVYVAIDKRVYRYTKKDITTANNDVPTGISFAVLPSEVIQLVVGQGYLLASTAKDGVLRIKTDATFTPVFTAPAPISLWYAKDRWILAAGPSLYEAVVKDTAQDLTKPLYTSPDPTFVWSSVTGTPGAILVSGYSNQDDSYSAIYAITVESSQGGAPTLTTPTVTAEFPSGEYLRDIQGYLGTYLLISTSRGVRLGLVGDNGQVTYGPLLGCIPGQGRFVTADRFAWLPVYDAGEGRSGVIRFDLSQISDEQKVAWSYDYRLPVDSAADSPWQVNELITLPGEEAMLLLAQCWRGSRVYSVVDGVEFEKYGVIQSGQIRMGSTVPKSWARFSLYAKQNMQGFVKAEIVTPTGVFDIGTLENPEFEEEWSFAHRALTSVHASVRLTLSRGAIPPGPPPPPPPPPPPDPPGPPPAPGEESWNSLRTRTWREITDSGLRWQDLGKNTPVTVSDTQSSIATEGAPVVEGWALRGTPAIERTELIRVGVLCFDWEVSNQGVRVGADGQAIARYRDLVDRLAPNTIVEFTDLNNRVTDWVTVDEMSYRQTAAPSLGSGFGGVIDLVLRVL